MKNLKRVLALVLTIATLLTFATVASAATVTDANQVDDKYEVAVNMMMKKEIIEGYNDGTFKPEQIVKRAEMAKMICVSLLGKEQAEKLTTNRQIFSDVPASHWAAGYIDYCYSQGIIGGYGNGKFGPSDPVTGYQAAKMILVAMGYTKKGAYEGTGWTVNVARDAMTTIFSSKLLGTTADTVSYNAPATRQEAAYYIFNGFTNPSVVYSEAADWYYAKDVAVLGKVKYTGTERDIWGRPDSMEYTLFATWGADVTYSVHVDPVVTYTTAITGCQLLKDVGYPETDHDTVTFWTVTDGAKSATSAYGNADGFAFAKETSKHNYVNCPAYAKDVYGGQGQVMEVYETSTDDEYEIVYINTYLALIGKTIKPSNSHTEYDTLNLTVYQSDDQGDSMKYYYETGTESYTQGAYALVTIANGVVQTVEEITPAATGVGASWKNISVQGTKLVNETSIVGGVTYNDAVKFYLGQNTYSANDMWNVYTDNYGNIIGLVKVISNSYGVITSAKWFDSADQLDDGYAKADIMKMDATTMAGAILDQYNDKDITSSANVAGKPGNATMAESSASLNQKWEDKLYTYTLNADGTYNVTNAGVMKTTDTIVNGKSNLWNGYATNDNTVYLVKNADGTYSSYTGYKNVPSMLKAVDVQYMTAGSFVTYAFVDATNVNYQQTTGYAYFEKQPTKVVATDSDNNPGYWAYIDGEKTVVYFNSADDAAIRSAITHGGVWTLTYNASGKVVAAAAPDWNVSDSERNFTVKGVEGSVITDGTGNSLTLSIDVALYQMASAAGGKLTTVTETIEIDELVGENVWCLLDANDEVYAIYFIA